MEIMYLIFGRMPGESSCRRLRSLLLCLYDVFRALINSRVVFILESFEIGAGTLKETVAVYGASDLSY